MFRFSFVLLVSIKYYYDFWAADSCICLWCCRPRKFLMLSLTSFHFMDLEKLTHQTGGKHLDINWFLMVCWVQKFTQLLLTQNRRKPNNCSSVQPMLLFGIFGWSVNFTPFDDRFLDKQVLWERLRVWHLFWYKAHDLFIGIFLFDMLRNWKALLHWLFFSLVCSCPCKQNLLSYLFAFFFSSS